MSLEVIYVTRHGFRSNWVVEPKTGTYSTSIPSPTGIASDPALAGYGVEQSHELSTHLQTLSPPIERFYTSPFYRCIQTISPAVEAIAKTASDPETCKIRGENGVGEWYGMARFDHPSPATPGVLKKLFERYDETIGRALTGRMPEDTAEEDFRPFTCGVSTFVRKNKEAKVEVPAWEGPETKIPHVEWRGGNGVGGGWEITKSGDCSFLSGGEERGWRFSGDESFVAKAGEGPALDAGSGLGVVIEASVD
ncbi:hypothetical protein M7I_6060 [Glarea lozoyensis 74030]|uniref:Phosphoglycerate mutase-like protein n=1 Tax=Glarea lozoyensis (strain ATCC 74030 / MF5533) TaxID=1104152 RepID=H0ETJ6_GLAL7|nr:hypothetical protein M7I_6060 [Glarea lozoyensis 74030]